MKKSPAVYIMANRKYGVLYTGVTSELIKRVYEHRESLVDGFTKRYACKRLVFFECHDTMYAAIAREKKIKSGSRADKIKLIESMNSGWNDLFEIII